MEAKHKEELEMRQKGGMGKKLGQSTEANAVDHKAQDSNSATLKPENEIARTEKPLKLSKAQRRRANKEAREAAQRAEIEKKLENMPDERKTELDALANQLGVLKMELKEVFF